MRMLRSWIAPVRFHHMCQVDSSTLRNAIQSTTIRRRRDARTAERFSMDSDALAQSISFSQVGLRLARPPT
jgi:hypothetical protein